jgi:hypothetical protein
MQGLGLSLAEVGPAAMGARRRPAETSGHRVESRPLHGVAATEPALTGGNTGRRPVVPIMQEPPQWSPLLTSGEHGRCVGLGGGGVVAAMEPAGAGRNMPQYLVDMAAPAVAPQWSPPVTSGEYGNHHPGSRRAAIAAMEAACNRREH